MSSKRKRRKPAQVIRCLAEGESMLAAGKPAAEVYQKFGIAESTWMRWKQRYGGMKSDEAKRLAELEVENQRLQELLAAVSVINAVSKRTNRVWLLVFLNWSASFLVTVIG